MLEGKLEEMRILAGLIPPTLASESNGGGNDNDNGTNNGGSSSALAQDDFDASDPFKFLAQGL